MPGTNFIDKNTVITASYMNGVDQAIYDAIGDGVSPPATPSEVRANLDIDNINNTLDINKPVSIPQQAALDLKLNITDITLYAVAKDSPTGAGIIPVGTTAERPLTPDNGYIRYNTDTNNYEGYKEGFWLPLGGGATGGGDNDVFYENSATVTVDYTITTNKNAMSAGPITIANGISVTVPVGSTWTIV